MVTTVAKPFRHAVGVYWEGTDAAGIVYYANYLKFFERARTEWLRRPGIEQQTLCANEGAMFIVSQTAMRYLSPARLDDLPDVTVAVRESSRATLLVVQQALRGEPVLADGQIRIACVDSPGLRPRRIAQAILQHLA